MKRSILTIAAFSVLSLFPPALMALVHYDQGRLNIDGVQLFQTVDDPDAYEYLPPSITLAKNAEGLYELLMAKYVGADDASTGGLFHALVQLELPAELRERVEERLSELRPGAELRGPVQLLANTGDDRKGVGSFQIVSATLNASGETPDRLASRVVTSGAAPFAPGSKASIAAMLEPTEATLLWDSLQGATSDVSVAVRGYFEARVQAYNAVVEGQMSVIYNHRSVLDSYQQEFTKRQVRDIADELISDGAINVRVFDASRGPINNDDMQAIVDLVTEKLVDVMFDRKNGWAREPDPEIAVESGQICDRQPRGFFDKLFSGATDVPYCSDDQYVIKQVENVAERMFYLNLARDTVIKVPFDTAGNIGGFYATASEDERAQYFRIIAVDIDPAMTRRQVRMQIAGDYAETFKDTFNLTTVNVQIAARDGQPAQSEGLIFDAESLQNGNTPRFFTLYRLGNDGTDWTRFRYQVAWNIRGEESPLRVPEDPDEWVESSDLGVVLTPPVERDVVYIATDNSRFTERGVIAAIVQIASVVNGNRKIVAETRILADDGDPGRELIVLYDEGAPLVAGVTWHTTRGRARSGPAHVTDNFLAVTLPDEAWFEERLSQ